jgi:hypothetical protein
VLGVIFRTRDDAWLVVGRQPHRLGLVELGILKGGEPKQLVPQPGLQPVLRDVDLIAQNELQTLGEFRQKRCRPTPRRRRRPRLVVAVLLGWQTDAQEAASTFSVLNDSFDVRSGCGSLTRSSP